MNCVRIVTLLTLLIWSVPALAGLNTPVVCAQLPSFTGAVSSSAGSCALSGSTSSPSVQIFTSGTSATYTTPAGAALLIVTACAGGGGGGGVGATLAPTGTTGVTTTFNSVTAVGGSGGTGVTTASGGTTGGAGGTGGTGTVTQRIVGTAGFGGVGALVTGGPPGGESFLGPRGTGGKGGASLTTSRSSGGGGGGGECFILRIPSPAASYTYTVGAGGGGGVGTGTSAQTGGAGADGIIRVEEYYGVLSASQTWTLISTQVASAASTIEWTGLGTTYNNYYMNCSQVFPSVNGAAVNLQFGQGGTPTWKTSGYKYSGFYIASTSATVNGINNDSDTTGSIGGNVTNNVLGSIAFDLFLFNIPLGTTNKTYMSKLQFVSASVSYIQNISGVYAADTTAATAIRLIPSSGTVTGTCSLYGLVQ